MIFALGSDERCDRQGEFRKAEILAKLPEGSSAVEWAEDRPNPLQICGWPTYELQLSYSAFGKRFTSTLLVCDLEEEQLRFRVVAPEADFAIAPLSSDPAVAERTFATLRELRDRLSAENAVTLRELSMGMSGDFAAAIAAGSTLVRVGTALFGTRESSAQ